ncbi:MAG: hypothetical protein OER95_02825 [Acidimicrobiia bacterium]|nr:hypothetical protein [Acidimicrobiia bacterium]
MNQQQHPGWGANGMDPVAATFVAVIDRLDLPDVNLVDDVLERLVEFGVQAGDGGRHNRFGWGLRLAAVVVVLVATLTVLVMSPVGEAVADWLGIGATGIVIEEGRETGSRDESSPSTGEGHLGRLVVPRPAGTPIPSLGPPDAVHDHPFRGRSYLWQHVVGRRVVLSARPTDSPLSLKSLAAADDVEFLNVDRQPGAASERTMVGVWIDAPHQLSLPVEGLDLDLTLVAGPVLIWVDGKVELRLEGANDRQQALALAAEIVDGTSLTPGG